jgi:hypothetical protein
MYVTDARVGQEPLQLRIESMGGSQAGGVAGTGRIWLPQDLPNGLTDVGDLVLTSPPVIASGIVLDDAGLPVAGATVSAAPAPSSIGVSSYSHSAVRSDRSGHFELRAAVDWHALLLTASQQGTCPTTIECALGRTDVVLRLSQAGEIAGRLLLPSGVHRYEIRIDCTREDAESDASRSKGLRVDEAGGAFRIVNLEPGVYSVDVALIQEGTRLLEARGLRVSGGETFRDPRLDPLDLTSVIHTHELRVRGDDGENVREIGLGWRKAGDASSETYGYSTSGGTLRAIPIFSMFEAIDLDVDASEMLKVHVPNVRGRAAVVMKRSVHVTLTLDETSRLPEAPFSIEPVLVSEQGELWSSDVFDARRVSTLTPAWIGRCEVRFQVFKENRGLDDAWIVPNPRQWVTIADQPKAQSFEVSFTPNELEQAMSVY